MMDQLQDKTVSEERWLTYVSVKETVSSMDERQQAILSKRFYLGTDTDRNCKRTRHFTSTNFKIGKKCSQIIRDGMEQE